MTKFTVTLTAEEMERVQSILYYYSARRERTAYERDMTEAGMMFHLRASQQAMNLSKKFDVETAEMLEEVSEPIENDCAN